MDTDYRKIREWHGPPECLQLPKRDWTLGNAQAQIEAELQKLGAADCMIETDHDLARDEYTISGRPRSGVKPPTSRVQLWFYFEGEPICMPAWAYLEWTENLKAIAMTLERQRLIRDYGVVTVRHQVQAFSALPPGAGALGKPKTCEAAARKILELAGEPITPESVTALIEKGDHLAAVYRRASKLTHPDKVGGNDLFVALGEAKATIEEHRRKISGK